MIVTERYSRLYTFERLLAIFRVFCKQAVINYRAQKSFIKNGICVCVLYVNS